MDPLLGLIVQNFYKIALTQTPPSSGIKYHKAGTRTKTVSINDTSTDSPKIFLVMVSRLSYGLVGLVVGGGDIEVLTRGALFENN